MSNKEAIEIFKNMKGCIESGLTTPSIKYVAEACEMAIKALEKDKCSSCKHYDKDYGETCLNPSGTCRVFEYDGYEEAPTVIADNYSMGYQDGVKKILSEKPKRPTGKWIFHKDYGERCRYGCNLCGNLTNVPGKFCPNCGAHM